MEKTGLLIVNLGTPKSTELNDIKSYLREFLSDPRVIDIPRLLQLLLVNLIIVPFRSKTSQKMYKEVWVEGKGSPLLFHSRSLLEKLQIKLPSTSVKLAMRYQFPSIESKLREFSKEGVQKIKVIPMFPQYSSATFGSVVEKVYQTGSSKWNTPLFDIIKPFYNNPHYINALKVVCQENDLAGFNPEVFVMSYHGLPERHCQKSNLKENGCKFDNECCEAESVDNSLCYRRQCFENSNLLAQSLGLKKGQFVTVFQSQFGKDKWIEPYLEPELEKLAKSGIKRIAVMAPSFTTDCLETVEEIGIRAKEYFKSFGGEDLKLIPCLNDSEIWADAIVAISEL